MNGDASDDIMGTIAENVQEVREKIARAAARAGRDPQTVTLIAVSKTAPAERVEEAVKAGLTIFGENRVQEARDKSEALARHGQIRWHLIGHLQTNKVSKAVSLFEVIHSVDSLKLMEKISEQAHNLGKVQPILLEMNLGDEATKSGMAIDELPRRLEQAARLSSVCVRGLMAIPPFHEDLEKVRPYFVKLRELGQAASRMGLPEVSISELSMGMSHDYTVAIEEGATMVRVGTAIFGERK